MRLQRIIQVLSVAAFLVLLALAAFPLATTLPVDAFLRLDPSVVVATDVSARTLIPNLWAGLLILALTTVIGRFFCSTICPLGATIDLGDRLSRPRRGSRRFASGAAKHHRNLKRLKFQVLMFVLGAAAVGVSFVFAVAPLPLATRLYGLLVYPVLCLTVDAGLAAVRPLANAVGINAWDYAQLPEPRYAYQWVTLALSAGVLAGALAAPRFWCRYLCPSGALLALCGRKPLVRRQVSTACVQCGLCRKQCPMAAIGEDTLRTDHGECIVCETCVRVCPTGAVRFGVGRGEQMREGDEPSTERRHLIRAGLSGLGAGIVTLTGLRSLHGEPGPGQVADPHLIRPPGALPEKDFLARCIRCGACMKACPSNTLQPIGFQLGISGFFSPGLTPRRGACLAQCNVCGRVCPTGAIRPLPLAEKIWAKVGTAYVLRHKCLTWEFGRKCLVCDEVCPYNAVEFKNVPGIAVAVPFVNENRCSGCGFCELHCPVQAQAAIVVEPMGALRLPGGSFRDHGQRAGLSLELRAPTTVRLEPAYGTTPAPLPSDATPGESLPLPPGFTR